MKTPRGISESSTTSDNTTEFIDIVKKYDVVYNTHNPDYKNVEVKMKVWSQIAQEIGLSIDASKRKWKNLRDSYTKYLRSFRVGTKTSKKYQYWAHAENMEFLKPYQGPGRNCVTNVKSGEEAEETECDLNYQVVSKAADDENKQMANQTQATDKQIATTSATPTLSTTNIPMFASNAFNAPPAPTGVLLPMPSLPLVQLPPPPPPPAPLPPPASLHANNVLTSTPAILSTVQTTTTTSPFKSTIPMPSCSTASAVGCLFIDPQQLSSISAENLKKEALLGWPAATLNSNPVNPKLRRTFPQTGTTATTTALNTNIIAIPPVKVRRMNSNEKEVDVAAVLQASRDLDANTLFFLSLARSVRNMPTKLQSLAKMRCMRIVSDIELEFECSNASDSPTDDAAAKYGNATDTNTDGGPEHFVYVMSPSRVENLIDISDDEMQNSGT